MDMNRITKIIINCIVGIAVFIALGIAGSLDKQEAIISSISNELYQRILHDLGGSASEREICDKYQENKKDYDSLGI